LRTPDTNPKRKRGNGKEVGAKALARASGWCVFLQLIAAVMFGLRLDRSVHNPG
jgi:hypothetical protein